MLIVLLAFLAINPDAELASWVQAQGGRVTKDAAAHVVTIDLRSSWVTDSDLGALAQLRYLKKLDLSYTHITDLGMEQLKPLPGIVELNLCYAEHVTDEGLAHLKGWKKLEWLNGVHLRSLSDEEYGDRLVTYLRERGIDWPEADVRETVPLVKEKISTLGQYPTYIGFLFHDIDPPADVDGGRPVLTAAAEELATLEPWAAGRIEEALRAIAERLELSPRKAFAPIRVAVTGSNVSPGLFESLELLGRDRSLQRIRAALA